MSSVLRERSFTLMELMIVVVTVGIIAGFAVPQFQKAMDRARERDAILNLQTIDAAEVVYRARYGKYWPGAGNFTINAINSALGLSIVEIGDTTYRCGSGDDSMYICEATLRSGNIIHYEQPPNGGSANPCCLNGGCQLVPDICE